MAYGSKKNTKKTNMKPLPKVPTYKQNLQHNVEKAQKPEKINPNQIFEGKKKVTGKKKN
tara:strand:- start:585 stop:761 length:177 start_codon:yes stop_codon:yes gene_type:complete